MAVGCGFNALDVSCQEEWSMERFNSFSTRDLIVTALNSPIEKRKFVDKGEPETGLASSGR
jgi:hypothetical protein